MRGAAVAEGVDLESDDSLGRMSNWQALRAALPFWRITLLERGMGMRYLVLSAYHIFPCSILFIWKF